MLVGLDVDGTVDSDPALYLALMQALRCAGHRVVILTGCSREKVEQQDIADKETYLTSLGVGEAYDELVVFADPPSEAKAEWLEAHHADLLVDNDKGNAKAAAGACPVLVPWQTRTK